MLHASETEFERRRQTWVVGPSGAELRRAYAGNLHLPTCVQLTHSQRVYDQRMDRVRDRGRGSARVGSCTRSGNLTVDMMGGSCSHVAHRHGRSLLREKRLNGRLHGTLIL
jgi:hypothetical protein